MTDVANDHTDARAVRDVVHVVFRYDDCSARSSIELERGLIQAFGDLGIQVTLAVIPFVCGADMRDPASQERLLLPTRKAELLRNAYVRGCVEIGLHGYCHQYWKTGVASEFAGRSVSEQRQRILEGRAELESQLNAPVTTFVPPWNAYDENTLQILDEEGFRCLSASLRGPFPDGSRRWLLPYSCWCRGLTEIVPATLRICKTRPVIVIMLHDFDFVESGRPEAWMTVDQLRTQLTWLKSLPYVRLRSCGQAQKQGVAMTGNQLRPAAQWRRWASRLPWRLRHLIEDQVLFCENSLGIAQYVTRQSFVSWHRVSRDFAEASRRKLRRLLCLGGGERQSESVAKRNLLPRDR